MDPKNLIIIKISGESLKGNSNFIDVHFVNHICEQIKEVNQKYSVAIVLGGGNIYRGANSIDMKMERYKRDQIGMLVTVMNSLVFQSAFLNIGVESKIFSTIEMNKIADEYIIRNIKTSFAKNHVVFFACGTGRPFFTTDTGIAVSAAELEAKYILMGKNNVDGVYDSDPNINKNAKFYPHLTYTKMINDELKVMDITAASICKQNKIESIIFQINKKNAIIDVLNNKIKHTLISE